ncbi:unnamed protein product [Spirodela intermedia]|uniref:Uncharacterized protein n=1 Tax=Spirodela intermedia TaxID=51605 RepID=A0A7I8J9Z4_SPIIN|nr:unnamed protein product [Spirodela intermedia]CAA6666595.1 unnamed protein product [Spirodela intermedia]
MGSCAFFLVKRLSGAVRHGECLRQSLLRLYSSVRSAPRKTLLSSILPLGNPSVSLLPELDGWAKSRKTIVAGELQDLVKHLRNRNRHKQALEVSEWMKHRESADSPLVTTPYTSCIDCPPYNNIMCLYANAGQLEKVPLVLAEMKKNGILPDNFSYRLCINSYGSRSRIAEMEEALEEMDCQPQIVVDWNTYAVVAHNYIKAGLPEKAAAVLKKSEEKMDRRSHICYSHLISLYGALKSKAEMRRLGSFRDRWLVRLGELEEAEDLLKRWESSGNMVDFRVPNVAMLDGFAREGKAPLPSSWGILARAFADKGEMVKAHHYMEKALCGYEPDKGWKPSPSLIFSVLQWLGDEANNPKDVEKFVELLKPVMPEIGLFRARMRAGNRADGYLESLKTDGIEVNESTREILRISNVDSDR